MKCLLLTIKRPVCAYMDAQMNEISIIDP